MRTSAAGSSHGGPGTGRAGDLPRRAPRGFTLIELLVVVAIVAIATASVSFALRDSANAALDRDAQRLAALLESARAQSRASGIAVRWTGGPGGFRFDGLPPGTLPAQWLSSDTLVAGDAVLRLGPEPLIGPQQVVLVNTAAPGRALRVATDGLRPFAVVPAP